MKNNYILGISAFFHDSSASLIKNCEIIAAVQEERFTRIKFDSSFPINSYPGIKHLSDYFFYYFFDTTFFGNNWVQF